MMNRRLLLPLLAVLACVCPKPVHADVIAPGAMVGGKSQADLAAAWWQWGLSYKAPNNPLLDPTGMHSALGNQGDVFFLAGFAGENNKGVFGVAERTAIVSPTQSLFFPILNGISATVDGIPAAHLPKAVADFVGTPDKMFFSLKNLATNETKTLGLADLLKHRQSPSGFDITLGPDSIYGVPAGTYGAAVDGYWLALDPLPVGTYELKFGGHSLGHLPNDWGYNGDPIDNSQDITYRITSQTPEPASMVMFGCGAVGLLAARWRSRRRASAN